ncbi:hypothetical protein EB796_014175 [Bugula neritina]|uniref:Uncharacterized protein n=1 Tax=Bugula neritina TaxID=10212 RepID=A0A7J7JME9_BUGNE|nr:hypothetical protein EB796_014175 [Bugula neritina]
MTGPHLNDQGKFDHGIPLKSANAKDRLMPPSHASQTHGRKHSKKKRKSRKEGKSSSTSKSGKKATSSDQEAGRTSKPESKRSQNGKMMLKSAAELRPLQTIRPLMGGKLVIPEKPKGDTSGLLRADTVIERYHDLYGKKSPGGKRKSHGGDEVRSHSSVDSDFSMCSDVIRNMSIHPAHYTPDSDEEDYV